MNFLFGCLSCVEGNFAGDLGNFWSEHIVYIWRRHTALPGEWNCCFWWWCWVQVPVTLQQGKHPCNVCCPSPTISDTPVTGMVPGEWGSWCWWVEVPVTRGSQPAFFLSYPVPASKNGGPDQRRGESPQFIILRGECFHFDFLACCLTHVYV